MGLGAAYAAGTLGGSNLPNLAPAPAHPPSIQADLRLAKGVPCRGNYPRLVSREVFSHFHPVTAVLCLEGFHTYPGQRQWEVLTRKVAVGGIPAYQRCFEQPDGPALTKGETCSAVLVGLVVPVFVDDQGPALVPRTPVDACGAPLARWGRLAARVGWRTVRVRRIRQLVSASALAARCPMRVGNAVAWAGPPRNTTGGPLFVHVPWRTRICIYRTTPDRLALGYFVRGFRLDRLAGTANPAAVRAILGAR